MRRKTALLIGAAAGLVVASAARAEQVTFVVPDFKGFKNVTVETVINTWIGIKKKIPFDGTISIGISDRITVKVTVPVPVFVPTYITITSSTGEASDPAIGTITFTDIYAVDLQPELHRDEIPLMTGFDPIAPQLQPLSPEIFRGLSGTPYPANVEPVRLADLATRLPGFDLSYFAQGSADSIVYVAQATVPPDDLIKPSSAWVGDVNDLWEEAGNWSPVGDPGGPNEPGHRVTFGIDAFPTLNPKVQLDVPRTVGEMEFFPGADTTIQGTGSLTLDNGPDSTGPAIRVFGGSHSILVPVNPNTDLAVNVAQGTLVLGGPVVIPGTSGLNLSGAGVLQLAGNVNVGGITSVQPESTLEVLPDGVLTTATWRNPGKDIVRGIANITQDLIVGDPTTPAVDSFFDVFGEVTVGGTTTVNPGGTLTVQPGGTFTTGVWRNPGRDIVLADGTANILQDLFVEGTGVFEVSGEVKVGGTTTVDPGATLEVRPGGLFITDNWVNPGKDIIRPGGIAQIANNLTVGGVAGATGALFEVGGNVTVGGTTLVEPGATLEVLPGGVFTTPIWRNPGRDIVRGLANITQDLIVGDPTTPAIDSFFDVFGEVNVGGMTLVYPGGTLTVQNGGTFRTNGWRNPGRDVVLTGGVAIIASDLRVEGTGLFEISGQTTVGGTTLVEPGATLEVFPGGVLTTNIWRNPGKDVVRGLANITQDLFVGDPDPTGIDSFFDVFGEVNVGGMTLVYPGGTLTVQDGGVFRTNGWRNPGKDVVLAGGVAIIASDLRVEGTGVFEISGETTVDGFTTVDPGATLQVFPGGVFRTNGWRNPGKDIVRPLAIAQIATDLIVGGEGSTGGLFDSGGQVSVGRMTSVTPGNLLSITDGTFQTARLGGGGAMEVVGGKATIGPKPRPWTANPEAVQDIGTLLVGEAILDLMNNRLDVKYGDGPTPFGELAEAVRRKAIIQGTGRNDRTVGIHDTGGGPAGGVVRIGYAAPGDTLMRGQVDSQDIINILSSGKYNAGPSAEARWDEGDFSHDRVVDSTDIIMLLSAGVYDRGVYDAEEPLPVAESVITGAHSAARATIIYDPSSGNVKIDPNGNTMSSFRLWDSSAAFFVASPTFPAGGAFTTDTAAQKFWSTFAAASYLVAVHDLGNIAPTGLSEAAFVAALNNAAGDTVWTAAAGGTFDYNITYVPEPSMALVLLLGGVMLARRRRAA